MKKNKSYIFVGLWFYVFALCAQNDTIRELDEVRLYTKLSEDKEVKGLKEIQLTSEQITNNSSNPTEFLRFNSPVVLRDVGNNGTSSARFRGTSPTNTAVLWNGISINTFGSGQTDFNGLSILTADEVSVLSGGASATYGSGAIGGVIHIDDKISFKKENSFHVFSSYGSFNTTNNFLKARLSNGKLSLKMAISYNSSDNDYPYIDERFKDQNGNDLINENGDYRNYNFDIVLGYKLNFSNKLFFYSSLYDSDRSFSLGLPNPSAGTEGFLDFNTRNLLRWESKFGDFQQKLSVAYIRQQFKYFPDQSRDNFNFGETEKGVLDYNLTYQWNKKVQLRYGILGESIYGKTEQISTENRGVLTNSATVTYAPFARTLFVVNGRYELNSDFEVPFLGALAVEQVLFKNIKLKANVSNNFRAPTLNELFWPIVGNSDLEPEKSKQFDLGIEYNSKHINFQYTYYNIRVSDKIVWQPGGSNVWRPINIDETKHRGFEVYLNLKYTLAKYHTINLVSNYINTIAQDLRTGDLLPFTPEQMVNFNLSYSYKKLTLFGEGLYQSKVFTISDNIDFFSLDPVKVFNIGTRYSIFKKHSSHQLDIGMKINNVGNQLYYFSNLRPNPGRNYNLSINYKF